MNPQSNKLLFVRHIKKKCKEKDALSVHINHLLLMSEYTRCILPLLRSYILIPSTDKLHYNTSIDIRQRSENSSKDRNFNYCTAKRTKPHMFYDTSKSRGYFVDHFQLVSLNLRYIREPLLAQINLKQPILDEKLGNEMNFTSEK